MFTDRGILAMTIVAIFTLALTVTVRAYEFAGGTGEPNDPYQLATADDLLAIGSNEDLLSKSYVLVNDIDLDPNLPGGRVFQDALIAQDQSEDVSMHRGHPFSGVFDGQGHVIRNLSISGREGYGAGLFGMSSGLIRDLQLQDVRISGSPCGAVAGTCSRGKILHCAVTGQIAGSERVGGLVGSLSDGAFSDCRFTGRIEGVQQVGGMVGRGSNAGKLVRCEVQGEIRGNQQVGGLAGYMVKGYVSDSRVSGEVNGVDWVGGLIGYEALDGRVFRCAVDARIVAEQTAGGLIGYANFTRGELILDCYVRGSVAGSLAGGLVGIGAQMHVVTSYAACEMISTPSPDGTPAALGGLFGEASNFLPPLVNDCFWDVTLSGVNLSTGRGMQFFEASSITAQLQQEAGFEQANWDLESVWAIEEGEYPVLQWQQVADAGQEADAGQ